MEIPGIIIRGRDSPMYATSSSNSLVGWGILRGKGRWTDAEDAELSHFVSEYGAGSWRNVAERTSLHRDAQSCRLRWFSYLDPNVSKAVFTPQEDNLLLSLVKWDSDTKWVHIAADRFPTRTGYQLQGRWHLLMNKRRRTHGHWWAKGNKELSPDPQPPCHPPPYASPLPPPLSPRHPIPIFTGLPCNGRSSQFTSLIPDAAPTLSLLPPLSFSTHSSGSKSSSAPTSSCISMPAVYEKEGDWMLKQNIKTSRFREIMK